MNNIVPQDYNIGLKDRIKLKGHRPMAIWFTGLSGSGKSTIANAVEQKLVERSVHVYALDGDNIRGGLNSNLGFSETDRTENLRRIAEVTKLFLDSGTLVLSAFISPLRSDRKMVAEIVGEPNFIEVFVNTSLEECERRDVKGLYKKARAGEIKNFTGIDAPYEAPAHPDVVINTELETIEESAAKVVDFLMPIIKLKNNE